MQPGQDEGRGEVEADRPHKRRHTQTNAGHPSDHHELAEKVAKTVIAQYEALPKTGKPQPHEHTVLCGFVLSRSCSASGGTSDVSELSCVAIGTGTKCLGGSQRSEAGDLVNDSHAEVIARRALLRWLYGQAETALTRGADANEGDAVRSSGSKAWAENALQRTEEGRLCLARGLHLHMYVSMPPCGDAAVHGTADRCQDDTDTSRSDAAAPEGSGSARSATPAATAQPLLEASAGSWPEHRTGAKMVQSHGTVPQSHDVEGPGGQQPGCLRRKPGRGAATLSMSCSDKIAKWCLLGVQGCLLSGFLAEPLLLTSLTVSITGPAEGGKAEAAEAALRRAIIGRCQSLAPRLKAPYSWAPPRIAIARPPPTSLRLSPPGSDTKSVPSGLAVNWSATATTIVLALNQKLRHQVGGSCADRAVHEVTLAASGRKAGANKKSAAWSSTKTRSSLCKVSMLDQAVHLHGLTQGRAGVAPPFRTYKEAKFEHLGRGYQECWSRLLEEPSVFARWLRKPAGLEGFAATIDLTKG